MPRPRRATPPSAPPAPRQLELFPEPVQVEPLDVRQVGGAGTRVRGVWRVRLGRERPAVPHRVFHDRHGWYCEEHGPTCRAVAVARTEAGAA